jgi:hypothetical protein
MADREAQLRADLRLPTTLIARVSAKAQIAKAPMKPKPNQTPRRKPLTQPSPTRRSRR